MRKFRMEQSMGVSGVNDKNDRILWDKARQLIDGKNISMIFTNLLEKGMKVKVKKRSG